MNVTQGDGPIIGPPQDGHRYVGHRHFWERALMSRRQFIGATVGAAGVVGLGSGLVLPRLALAAGSDPNPIPGGIVVGGQLFHVFLLGEGNEPATITDFKGSIGVAEVQGTGTGINTRTGQHETLNFDTDMRFMQGIYIGMDGKQHSDTFGFIWLDLYRGQVVPNDFSNQIHDFNPGIAPSGLFWTIRVSDGNVQVDLDKATASMVIGHADIKDFFNIPNALFGPQPPIPASVSFELRWSGVIKRVHTRDATNRFVGDYIEDTATLRWSAKEDGFHFVSDPAHTSTTVFAEIGSESNGVFFS